MTHSSLFTEWAEYNHDPMSGSFISLAHKDVPSDEGQHYGTWVLTMHSFTPTWKLGGPAELFILGYCLTGSNVKRLVSYRVHLNFSQDQSSGVELSLVDAGCTLTPVLPWDKSCMFNSGHIICLRERVSCFRLFTNMDEPLCILELEDHPWLCDGDGPFSTSVDPFSGKVVVVSDRQLVTYRFHSTAGKDNGEEARNGPSIIMD